MNKKFTKFISLSLITSIFITGCSIKPLKPQNEISNLDKIKKSLEQRKKKFEPIKEIKISSYTIKKSNINHNLKDKNKYMIFSLKEINSLGELSVIDNNEIIVSPLIKNNKLPNIELRGTKKEILDKIAYFTNTYWTTEYNIIKFKKTAQLVYTFPALSLSKINEVYNVGEGEMANPLGTEDSLFKDIESVLTGLIDSHSLEAEIVYATENSFTNSLSNENSNFGTNLNEKSKTKNKKNLSNNDKENSNDFQNKDSLKTNSQIDLSAPAIKAPNIPSPKNNKKKRRTNKKNKNGDLLKNLSNTDSINKNKSLIKSSKSIENGETGLNKISKNISNKNLTQNTNKGSNTGKLNVTEKFSSSKNRIILSPNSGTVIANVTPNEEKILDTILNSLMKKRFGSMIRLKTYAILVDSSRIKSFNMEMSGLLSSTTGSTAGIGSGNFSFKIPSAATDISQIDVFNALVKYLTEDNQGKVLLNPTIISLPSVMTRIQDTSNIPYLEPSQLTNDNTNNITYNIAYVKEGINMAAISNVFDNNIIMALKFNVTQYLGDKTIEAGVLGSFNLPLSAPKIIQTTYRVSPGDIIVLGGVKQSKYTKKGSNTFNLPTGYDNEKQGKEFIFLVQPTIIKFVVDKTISKNESFKDISQNQLNKMDFRVIDSEYEDKKSDKNQKKDFKSSILNIEEKTLKKEKIDKKEKVDIEKKTSVEDKILLDFNKKNKTIIIPQENINIKESTIVKKTNFNID